MIARWLPALAGIAIACGGAGTAPPPAVDPLAPETSRTPVNDEAAGTGPAATDAGAPPPSDDARPGSDVAAPAGDEPREVTYRPTAGGLVVEVDGARLSLTAEPVKRKDGWGLRLDAAVSSIGDATHRVRHGPNGIFAVSATVERRGKGSERTPDTTTGDDERLITPGEEVKFSREWPGADGRGAAAGDSVTLQVGLWGLAREGADRRPVRKLAIVRMVVGQGKPRVFLNPPE